MADEQILYTSDAPQLPAPLIGKTLTLAPCPQDEGIHLLTPLRNKSGGRLGSSLRWHEQVRYSSRQKSRQLLGGLCGTLEVEGGLAPFLPLLRTAEVVHLGKETSFGLGKIRVEVLG